MTGRSRKRKRGQEETVSAAKTEPPKAKNSKSNEKRRSETSTRTMVTRSMALKLSPKVSFRNRRTYSTLQEEERDMEVEDVENNTQDAPPVGENEESMKPTSEKTSGGTYSTIEEEKDTDEEKVDVNDIKEDHPVDGIEESSTSKSQHLQEEEEEEEDVEDDTQEDPAVDDIEDSDTPSSDEESEEGDIAVNPFNNNLLVRMYLLTGIANVVRRRIRAESNESEHWGKYIGLRIQRVPQEIRDRLMLFLDINIYHAIKGEWSVNDSELCQFESLHQHKINYLQEKDAEEEEIVVNDTKEDTPVEEIEESSTPKSQYLQEEKATEEEEEEDVEDDTQEEPAVDEIEDSEMPSSDEASEEGDIATDPYTPVDNNLLVSMYLLTGIANVVPRDREESISELWGRYVGLRMPRVPEETKDSLMLFLERNISLAINGEWSVDDSVLFNYR